MKARKLIFSILVFLVIIFYGVIKINIQWTKDMIESQTPYKEQAVQVLAKDNINANKYAIDRTTFKIYYTKGSDKNIRIDFWDYVFIWSEEALIELKSNISQGFQQANSNIKGRMEDSMNKLKGILP